MCLLIVSQKHFFFFFSIHSTRQEPNRLSVGYSVDSDREEAKKKKFLVFHFLNEFQKRCNDIDEFGAVGTWKHGFLIRRNGLGVFCIGKQFDGRKRTRARSELISIVMRILLRLNFFFLLPPNNCSVSLRGHRCLIRM